jgi:hypothetical protein
MIRWRQRTIIARDLPTDHETAKERLQPSRPRATSDAAEVDGDLRAPSVWPEGIARWV